LNLRFVANLDGITEGEISMGTVETKDELVEIGTVESLHLHPEIANSPMKNVDSFEVVEGKGIMDDERFYDRGVTKRGRPFLRHLTMLEGEKIKNYAVMCSVDEFMADVFRSNMVVSGVKINLNDLIDKKIYIGSAIVQGYCLRTPCRKMDDVIQGLQTLMRKFGSGIISQIIKSGKISKGDKIYVRKIDLPKPI